MNVLVLAALLLLGSVSPSDVDEPSLSETSLDQGPHNVSRKPRLQPKESKPPVGNYTIANQGRVCLRASLGVVYIVTEDKNTSYYNLDPKSTTAGGYCASTDAVLSLEFDGGSLQFTFVKNGTVAYVKTLRAFLEPEPPCKNCNRTRYPGILNHDELFKTANGQSFKCKSSTKLILAENLRIKLVPLQVQAFNLPNGTFGKEVECWADYAKRIMPIVVGAVVVGIFLIAVLVFVLMREHRAQGYEPL
ncbi:lysosome-associated membrane glycoprotein 3 [Trichomycterus rosablanca]|uniref:lysosome-associated membrane glycoprotein 3 n=1 Tax=Trichomycterus rosablanca TaxID=2290929 RepID=UPI002F361066